MYEIKNIIPWKVLERFLFTSYDISKTYSFAAFTGSMDPTPE